MGVRWFREAGGMAPAMFAPSSRPLSGRYLSFAEREEIALWRAQGFGVCEIAGRLDRSALTISRELRRNAVTRGGCLDYRAIAAQWHAERSARRPKRAKLLVNGALRTYVQVRLPGWWLGLEEGRCPGRISSGKGDGMDPGRAAGGPKHGARSESPKRTRTTSPNDQTMRISHEEAIYQALYVQSRGALRRELTTCLRTHDGFACRAYVQLDCYL